MTPLSRGLIALPILLVGLASEGSAGKYQKSESGAFDPGNIVHPRNYTGTGGLTTIKICTTGAAQTHLSADLEYAMKLWNELVPYARNCSGTCDEPGEITPASSYSISAHTLLTHELGHCALGLDHPNLVLPTNVHTSYSSLIDYTSISVWTDLVAGSSDDKVLPLPGARNLHWFRTSDNDPTIVDSTAIHSTTYSRNYLLRPAGHNWIANANAAVGNLLGRPKTQAVMESAAPPNSDYVYLSADDVNTVKYAMNGLDATLASNGDNYTYLLSLEPSCATADIVVDFTSISGSEFSSCAFNLTSIPGSSLHHYRMSPALGQTQLLVTINNTPPFTYVLHFLIFIDGFEPGTASNWSDIVP